MKRWICSIFLCIFSLSIAAGYLFAVDDSMKMVKRDLTIVGHGRVLQKMQEAKATVAQTYHNHPLVLKAYDEFSTELISAYDHAYFSGRDVLEIVDTLCYCSDAKSAQFDEDLPSIVHTMKVVSHLIRVGQIYQKEVLISAMIDEIDHIERIAGGLRLAKAEPGIKIMNVRNGGGWSL